MHINQNGDLAASYPDELKRYYQDQETVAKLDRNIRVAGCLGALTKIAEGIDPKQNAKIISVTSPTLR